MNALALLAGRTGLLLLGLWLNGQLARTLGVAGLGRYLLALTIEGIGLSLASVGLNVYAVREFARRDAEDARALLATILALKAIAAVLGIAVLNGTLVPLFLAGPRGEAVAWASLGLLPQALNGGLVALLNGRQRMEVSSAIDLVTRLAGVLGGLVVLVRGGDERHVLACYVVGHLLATAALLRVVSAWRLGPRWRVAVGAGQNRTAWLSQAREVLGESLPFAGVDMVAILYRRLDLLLLGHWYSDGVVGIYGAAYRLWETLGMLPSSLLDALYPELSRRAVLADRRAHLKQFYRRGVMALLVLVLVVGSASYWLAPQLMARVYGRSAGVVESTRLFRVLVLALPFTYLYLLNGHVLYAAGEQRRVLRAMTGVTAGNALLNGMLIPRWGIWGAVGVAALSEAVLLALLGRLALHRVLHRSAWQDSVG
jgi:O-antigen/teichoic acid export membrane protein